MDLSATSLAAVSDVSHMARECYGYGCWNGPYWFIGPEQGQAPQENDDLTPRVKAWTQLGRGELNDCREFHGLIGETRWHRERPQLQSTWRALMLLLMSFCERQTENEALRNYQRDHWGSRNGETCVIELSGLAARNLKVPRDRDSFRADRIRVIRERIVQYHPELVVMYGTSEKEYWDAISGRTFPPDNILRIGRTVMACTPHPTSFGMTNAYWIQLGKELRQLAQNS